MRWPSRARVSPTNPRAFAICDRCGQLYNHADLSWQMEYSGTGLVDTGLLVCDRCLDDPNPQLLARNIQPDPVSIVNARPLNYDPYAGLDPQTELLLLQMENQPTPAVVLAIDNLMVAGVVPLLSKLDVFYMAVQNRQASTINWVSPGTYTLQNLSGEGPEFWPLQGFMAIANTTTSLLDTGFSPGAVGAKMSQNSAHIGVLAHGASSIAGIALAGNTNLTITPRNSLNDAGARVSNSGAITLASGVTTGNQHTVAVRASSSSITGYIAGVAQTPFSQGSTGLSPSETLYVCGSNRSTDVVITGCPVRCMHAGSALTALEVSTLSSAISTFVAAVGG